MGYTQKEESNEINVLKQTISVHDGQAKLKTIERMSTTVCKYAFAIERGLGKVPRRWTRSLGGMSSSSTGRDTPLLSFPVICPIPVWSVQHCLYIFTTVINLSKRKT